LLSGLVVFWWWALKLGIQTSDFLHCIAIF
jgi:hypothetical protein